jgi:hypothetical protein
MNVQGVPGPIQDRVRRKCSQEEMASAVIGNGVFFVRDAMLKEPDGALGKLVIDWFESATTSPTLAAWVTLLMKRVLNGISRVELFED